MTIQRTMLQREISALAQDLAEIAARLEKEEQEATEAIKRSTKDLARGYSMTPLTDIKEQLEFIHSRLTTTLNAVSCAITVGQKWK